MRIRSYLVVLFSFLFTMKMVGQEIAVTGKVISQEDKGPMPGINIIIKGTSTGTATDVSGTYKIMVPSGDAVLMFSFIGFETQEVRVGKRSVIDIIMLPDFKQLE